MDNLDTRRAIIEACLAMNKSRINQGTSGNISVRCDGGLLITPLGMPYDLMQPQDIVFLSDDGAVLDGGKPSSEWQFHCAVMKARPDKGAMVHTHAPFCTMLAIHQKPIPAVHYMVAAAGGHDIPCTPYAVFGSKALSDHVVRALTNRDACLMAHHGMIAIGADLPAAMALAIEVEALARQYHGALQIGTPEVLSPEEMDKVSEKMRTYGYAGRGKTKE